MGVSRRQWGVLIAAAIAAGCNQNQTPPPGGAPAPPGADPSGPPGASTSTPQTVPGGDGGPSTNAACRYDFAIRAAGASMTFPTPQPLAEALNALAFDPHRAPITVVYRHATNTIAASVTEPGPTQADVFAPGKAGTFVPAVVSAEGFKTSTTTTGTIRFVDAQGNLDLKLSNLRVRLLTEPGCVSGVAVVDAILDASEGSKQIHPLSGGAAQTIDSLAGGTDRDGGALVGWGVRFLFAGESISFDFSSL